MTVHFLKWANCNTDIHSGPRAVLNAGNKLVMYGTH